jgi:hypothetical protein
VYQRREVTPLNGPVLSSEQGEREVTVTFSAFQRIDSYISDYLITVAAERLTATAPVTSDSDGDHLVAFIEELAEGFRGWQGERTWRSMEDQLRISATWRSGGHVALTFRATPSIYDKWAVTADVTVEAGEDMRRFADDLAIFFRG